MAILFSKVTMRDDYNEAEFFVSGFPQEPDDLEGWTAYHEFLDEISEDTQIAVTGCDPERLEAFSKMLAGECTLSESNRWLSPAIDDEPFELKMQ